MIYCVSNINKRIEIERKKARLHAKESGFFNIKETLYCFSKCTNFVALKLNTQNQ